MAWFLEPRPRHLSIRERPGKRRAFLGMGHGRKLGEPICRDHRVGAKQDNISPTFEQASVASSDVTGVIRRTREGDPGIGHREPYQGLFERRTRDDDQLVQNRTAVLQYALEASQRRRLHPTRHHDHIGFPWRWHAHPRTHPKASFST